MSSPNDTTPTCTSECARLHGHCLKHAHVEEGPYGLLIVGDRWRRDDLEPLYITAWGNPYIRFREWENGKGLTWSRGHMSTSVTYASEMAGKNKVLFGHSLYMFVIHKGQCEWRY